MPSELLRAFAGSVLPLECRNLGSHEGRGRSPSYANYIMAGQKIGRKEGLYKPPRVAVAAPVLTEAGVVGEALGAVQEGPLLMSVEEIGERLG